VLALRPVNVWLRAGADFVIVVHVVPPSLLMPIS
jgi:hypothetical protein